VNSPARARRHKGHYGGVSGWGGGEKQTKKHIFEKKIGQLSTTKTGGASYGRKIKEKKKHIEGLSKGERF